MRTGLTIWVAAALALFPSAASAKRAGWCEVTSRVGNHRLWSGIVEFGDSDADYLQFRDEGFGPAFRQYVISREGDSQRPECSYEKSLHEAEGRMRTIINANPSIEFRKTDWVGGYPRATDGPPASSVGGNGLLIEKRGQTPAEAAAQRAARELEGQRAAAAVNAKRIAEAARSEAVIQAQIAKFLAELKKRGSAQ